MTTCRWVWLGLAVACGPGQGAATDAPDLRTCDEAALSATYERYVEPFVSGAVTASCSQCHMTGIDLSLYVQDSPCDTFACMVELGVVDMGAPENSEVLRQIRMGDPSSSVFDVGREEAAMREWIEWNAACHDTVCDIPPGSACTAGTGAPSTGRMPLGDCTEEDLLGVFWDTVIVDRGRCLICHSDFGQQRGTFGPCNTTEDCEFQQICSDGTCYAPGPLLAPHFFEGVEGALDWNESQDRLVAQNTLYNIVALGFLDPVEPLDSTLLTKPLLEDFTPSAVLGDGVNRESIAAPAGIGVAHGGTSKFNFGCHDPPCPSSGVVDCRTDVRCSDAPCPGTRVCSQGFCREPGSVCDQTYVSYLRFAEYFAECSSP